MKGKTKELLERAKSPDNAEKSDASVNGAERRFDDVEEARRFFRQLESRLLDLAEWNSHSALSSYALFDENGREIEGKSLAENDFIRISLKGALKYDWVRVAEIYRAPSETIITVRPTFDPTEENLEKVATSHFFTSEATNNFCVQEDENVVSFYVIGLNEETNLDETANVLETVRNAAVANLGAYLGVQSGEWNTFCHNFLELETDNK